MTKNNAMRLGSVMLVLALLSTCALWGTFAKYTTEGTAGTDTARVAKWGVTVTADTATAGFATTYAKADSSSSLLTGENSVSSSDEVLAPGTSSGENSVAPTLTGTPEVALQLSLKGSTMELTGNWEDAAGNFYFPVTVKVGGTAVSFTSCNTAADVKTAFETACESYTKNVEAGTDLSTVTDLPKITWEWAFSSSDENDAKDTNLGNIAAGTVTGKTAPRITFTSKVTATQLD